MHIFEAAQGGAVEMAGKLVKTDAPRRRPGGSPGIFERINLNGERTAYVGVYYERRGKQRKISARTVTALERLLEDKRVDARRGHDDRDSTETFDVYARPTIESYQGRTTRGFSEETRDEYRRDLERHVIPYIYRTPLCDIEAPLLRGLGKHLEEKGRTRD